MSPLIDTLKQVEQGEKTHRHSPPEPSEITLAVDECDEPANPATGNQAEAAHPSSLTLSDSPNTDHSDHSAAPRRWLTGGKNATPVTAQTVFDAHAPPQHYRRTAQWGVIAIILTGVLIMTQWTIPTAPVIEAPPALVNVDGHLESLPPLETALADHTTDTLAPHATDPDPNAMPSEAVTVTAAAPPAPLSQPISPSAAPSDRAGPETVVETTERRIQIKRHSADTHGRLLHSALQHHQNGRLDAAAQDYRAVLAALPEHSDALLGLASIVARQGRPQETYALYLNILKNHPDHSIARAALLNARRQDTDGRHEAALKTLLRKEPDNAFLHASLAHLYALQARWHEAQQAFFNAYRHDPSNPDYAFNLAVGLERIGQRRSAIDHYQRALSLADRRPDQVMPGFDRAVVTARLDTLLALERQRQWSPP